MYLQGCDLEQNALLLRQIVYKEGNEKKSQVVVSRS